MLVYVLFRVDRLECTRVFLANNMKLALYKPAIRTMALKGITWPRRLGASIPQEDHSDHCVIRSDHCSDFVVISCVYFFGGGGYITARNAAQRGFIPPANIVLAGLRFRRGAIIAGGAILCQGFCRDETPSGPRFIREHIPVSTRLAIWNCITSPPSLKRSAGSGGVPVLHARHCHVYASYTWA